MKLLQGEKKRPRLKDHWYTHSHSRPTAPAKGWTFKVSADNILTVVAAEDAGLGIKNTVCIKRTGERNLTKEEMAICLAKAEEAASQLEDLLEVCTVFKPIYFVLSNNILYTIYI